MYGTRGFRQFPIGCSVTDTHLSGNYNHITETVHYDKAIKSSVLRCDAKMIRGYWLELSMEFSHLWNTNDLVIIPRGANRAIQCRDKLHTYPWD